METGGGFFFCLSSLKKMDLGNCLSVLSELRGQEPNVWGGGGGSLGVGGGGGRGGGGVWGSFMAQTSEDIQSE